jgi:hypothetical protein
MKSITKRNISLIISLTLLCSFSNNKAQEVFDGYQHLFKPVRNYIVYQSLSEIEIDGKMNEESWYKAAWTEYFSDIEGDKMPEPLYHTRVKMLWDKQFLYIFAELEEPHVWGYFENRDMIVYNENDFEIFIDPNGDSQNYFEIEVNARNIIFDLFMPQPYRDGGAPLFAWNAPGIKSAVHVDGTLNNPYDEDKCWTVEMAVPFGALQIGTGSQTPADKRIWRINFSRVQWQTEIKEGIYHRKSDPSTGRILPEFNWVWSPQGIINMHYPERWGMIQFSKNRVGEKEVKFNNTTLYEQKKLLWLVYYKQKKHQSEHGRYAASLSEILLPETLDFGTAGKIKLEQVGTPYQYILFLTTENNKKLSVNENGVVR